MWFNHALGAKRIPLNRYPNGTLTTLWCLDTLSNALGTLSFILDELEQVMTPLGRC